MKEAALKLWTEKGWINIFPKTKAELVQLSDGRSVAEVLDYLLKNPISFSINIENGTGAGSLQQRGNHATGANSVAFGSRTEYLLSPTTKAEGENSIAAGASALTQGYASAAFNRKTQALQYGCFVAGGGNIAGKTLDEFRDWVKSYTDNPDSVTVGTVTKYTASDRTYCYDSSLRYEEQYYVLHPGYGDTHYDYKRFETYATAFGENNKSRGRSSITYGMQCEADGEQALAGGFQSKALARYAVALNYACIANAKYAMAINYLTKASGEGSFAANSGGVAGGLNSAKFGTDSKANAENAFVTGYNCIANAKDTYAGGNSSQATAWLAYAYGQQLRASATTQTVFGRFNKVSEISTGSDWELFQIGNGWGTADNQRRNAFGVRYDGTAYLGSAPKRDTDIVRKIDLENYVTEYLKSKGLI